MKVKDLKALLSLYPDDMEIGIAEGGYTLYDVFLEEASLYSKEHPLTPVNMLRACLVVNSSSLIGQIAFPDQS